MNRDLIDAAVALAATLAQENAALAALDFAGAASLLDQKESATGAFAAAQRNAAGNASVPLAGPQREVAEQLGRHLQDLAGENRRLLERAIHVQRRVVGTVVKAVPRALAGPPGYGATGSITQSRRPPPVVLSARA